MLNTLRRTGGSPAPTLLAALCLSLPLATWAQELPAEVDAALRRAKLPESALVVAVHEVGSGAQKLGWREREPVNPASVFKLVTTYAALDQWGPAWSWRTPVWVQGTVKDGVLEGNLIIKGSGDPSLVLERVWLMLRRVQQLGIREIRGDVLLDRSLFSLPVVSPKAFDDDASQPYNVRPDALMMNFKAVTYTFTPDMARGLALVQTDPPLAGVRTDDTVPLAAVPCEDWSAQVKAQWGEPKLMRFGGRYPVSCGERSFSMAYADPASFNARMVEAMWLQLGGRLSGQVKDGVVPPGSRLLMEQVSPPLQQVVRDINKFSNNVMAEQVFLSLGLADKPTGPITPDDAREQVRRFLVGRLGEDGLKGWVVDNGSGLSRENRLTAGALSRLLQQAWASPVMAELMSSLPISGVDGTLRRSKAPQGRAHLKTGSLRDVAAVAGYVLSNSGKRYVLVAIVNHPNAAAGRPAFDALVQWTIRDAPTR
ncbi:D-alanyl-D-alanine carboxypeptidase/D-alanyl-D-alanine-endopeptidase [Ideonella sp.]|jgi:D-alanyl-D-alanine carboxypeptidase/D-alanyl-D-alanine-endopeptidase (penicillin-binding protein 4)|uniref:D-alanyl-D-alanine carboxypeptidase/D-alanyl-D-alanine endopeptidase n=1 Tax=Ideonella sp. TaxID=1929293 RepID=UPI0037BE6EDE